MVQLTTRDYKGAGNGRRASPSGGLKEFLLGALAGALLAGLGTVLVMRHERPKSPTRCALSGAAAPAPRQPAARTAPPPMPQTRTPSGSPKGPSMPVQSAAAPAPSAVHGTAPRRTPPGARTPELAQRNVHDAAASARNKSAPAQPQYDFYQMLPNLKVTVPSPSAPGARTVGPNGRTEFAGYVLQVGAYRDPGQARRVVSYLDSLGILAHIDTVHDGSGPLYRVRIGPIIERWELNRFRGVLKRIGLPGVLIPGATH